MNKFNSKFYIDFITKLLLLGLAFSPVVIPLVLFGTWTICDNRGANCSFYSSIFSFISPFILSFIVLTLKQMILPSRVQLEQDKVSVQTEEKKSVISGTVLALLAAPVAGIVFLSTLVISFFLAFGGVEITSLGNKFLISVPPIITFVIMLFVGIKRLNK